MSRHHGPQPVIFLHVRKTAGTTVTEALRLRGDAGYLGLGNVFRDEEECRERIRRMRKPGCTVRFAGGHLPFSFRPLFPEGSRFMTFLREPVDRCVSHFYYLMKRREKWPRTDLPPPAEDADLATIALERRYIPDNLHVRMLSGYPLDAAPSSAMLEAAKENLSRSFAVIGIVERFDESLALIHSALAWPLIVAPDKRVNKLRPSLEDIPSKHLVAVRSCNELDLELYDLAVRLFDERVESEGESLARLTAELRSARATLSKKRPGAVKLLGAQAAGGA